MDLFCPTSSFYHYNSMHECIAKLLCNMACLHVLQHHWRYDWIFHVFKIRFWKWLNYQSTFFNRLATTITWLELRRLLFTGLPEMCCVCLSIAILNWKHVLHNTFTILSPKHSNLIEEYAGLRFQLAYINGRQIFHVY